MEREGICLWTANPADRIALRGVRLRSRLSGMSQRTTVEQTFVNLEPRAIEAVYTFPLPEGAAVCGFEVVTADRVLTGTVEESDAAIERYEGAIDEGHGAFLMEQERPDVFTVRVGNLKPSQAATVRLTYVCALERMEKQIRVAFPTTVAPRYVTATGTDPLEAIIDGDAVNPPHVLHVPYGLSMEVEIDLGRQLKGVYSPSHSIRVENEDEGRSRVTLAGGVAEMNRDVVLSIELKKELEPTVQAAKGPDGASYLAVTFVPEFEEDELVEPDPVETVFVLDCSGSMQGDSIRQAVAALELCLRSLSPGDTFNVCRFGSSFELMSSEPLPYSDATLKKAVTYIRRNADLGGTELYAPLEAIFAAKPRAGTVRQVILLTDGQVSNEPAVIDLARKHRAHNRVFSFGIGAAASAHLVKGIARATGGAAEFITTGERIDDKVLRTFGRLASPMVSEVSIDWDNADVQTLAELPPVFDGDVMAVFGRTPGRLPAKVTLSCKTPRGPKRWSVPVNTHPVDDGNVIATMWARRTIQSLEEVNAIGRARKGKASKERETLIKLSKEFGLLCSLTTFIAVEHRSLEERNEGRPALRRVPVQLAEGWGMLDEVCASPPAAVLGELSGDQIVNRTVARTSDARVPQQLSGFFGKLKKAACGGGNTGASAAEPPRLRSMDRTMDRSVDRSIFSGKGPAGSALGDGSPGSTIFIVDDLIETMVRGALLEDASEIHFEVTTDRLQVRYRKDDSLVERDRIPLKLRMPIVSRLKSLAALNCGETRLPQNGSIRLVLDGVSRDLHVSTLPTSQGESVVIRIPPDGSRGLPPTAEDLRDLLALQSAEGYFGWSGPADHRPEEILRRAGHDAGAWKRVADAAVPAAPAGASWQHDRAARTVLVLLLLPVCFASQEPLWRRAYRKASRHYLSVALGRTPDDVEQWLDGIRRTLAAPAVAK